MNKLLAIRRGCRALHGSSRIWRISGVAAAAGRSSCGGDWGSRSPGVAGCCRCGRSEQSCRNAGPCFHAHPGGAGARNSECIGARRAQGSADRKTLQARSAGRTCRGIRIRCGDGCAPGLGEPRRRRNCRRGRSAGGGPRSTARDGACCASASAAAEGHRGTGGAGRLRARPAHRVHRVERGGQDRRPRRSARHARRPRGVRGRHSVRCAGARVGDPGRARRQDEDRRAHRRALPHARPGRQHQDADPHRGDLPRRQVARQ